MPISFYAAPPAGEFPTHGGPLDRITAARCIATRPRGGLRRPFAQKTRSAYMAMGVGSTRRRARWTGALLLLLSRARGGPLRGGPGCALRVRAPSRGVGSVASPRRPIYPRARPPQWGGAPRSFRRTLFRRPRQKPRGAEGHRNSGRAPAVFQSALNYTRAAQMAAEERRKRMPTLGIRSYPKRHAASASPAAPSYRARDRLAPDEVLHGPLGELPGANARMPRPTLVL